MAALRVLVVDDSRIFRTVLSRILTEAGGCEVVGSEFNGERALDFLAKNQVDVVTLDVEMPGLNGLEVLQKIRQASWNHPKPAVIMVSAHTSSGAEITMKALDHGALGFVPKPKGTSSLDAEVQLAQDLSIQLAAVQSHSTKSDRYLRGHSASQRKAVVVPDQRPVRGLIAIGSSTGGPQALNRLLPLLCAQVDVPIVITQHMPPLFTASLAKTLDARCESYSVVEASHGMVLESNVVAIAPGGKHLRIASEQGLRCRLDDGPNVKGCKPSVDVLFSSVASLPVKPMTAVILTGMGDDGSGPLQDMRKKGINVIAQDEATSVVWGMPGKAVATGQVQAVVPLGEMDRAIVNSLSGAKV